MIFFSLETVCLFGASLLRAGLGNLMYAFIFAKWDKGTFGVLLLGAGGSFNHQVKEREGSPGDSSLLPRVGSLGRQWSSHQESKALRTHRHLFLMWFRSSACNDPESSILELDHPFILHCFLGRNSTNWETKQNSPSVGWQTTGSSSGWFIPWCLRARLCSSICCTNMPPAHMQNPLAQGPQSFHHVKTKLMVRKNVTNCEIQSATLQILLTQKTYWFKWELQLQKKRKKRELGLTCFLWSR